MTAQGLAHRPLARSDEHDRFFDYCLQPYTPPRPTTGKLRSENLLWHSLEHAGAWGLAEPLSVLQSACGRDMTVFGVKHAAGRLWWELYFYDPEKRDARVRATSVGEVLKPFLDFDVMPRETIPYFMFSFDLTPSTMLEGQRRIDGLNLYLAYHEVQGGRAYKMTKAGTELDNVYRFYQPKTEIREILHDLKSSVFVDYQVTSLSKILLPELFTCRKICVAKKRFADAVYYSGITVEQLLWFLRRFSYPEGLVAFIDGRRAELDHLLFDVGVDYTTDSSGALVMTKSSYYGTL